MKTAYLVTHHTTSTVHGQPCIVLHQKLFYSLEDAQSFQAQFDDAVVTPTMVLDMDQKKPATIHSQRSPELTHFIQNFSDVLDEVLSRHIADATTRSLVRGELINSLRRGALQEHLEALTKGTSDA